MGRDCVSAAQDDELEVEAEELDESVCQGPESEELGAAVEARVVVDPDFGNEAAAEFDLADEFHANGAAGRC